MSNKSSRDIILQRLNAVKTFDWAVPSELPSHFVDLFPTPENPLEYFKETLEKVGGEVIIVIGKEEVIQQLKKWRKDFGWNNVGCTDPKMQELILSSGFTIISQEEAEIVFTPCEFLIATTGSALVSSSSGLGRKAHVSPKIHVVLATASQLKLQMGDAIEALKNKYDEMPSWVGLITGPSRTADIEKTLVMGAHGPSEFIVLIDEEL